MSNSVSQAFLRFIQAEESCRLRPYLDSRGLATIGTGHLLQGLSLAQANALYPNGITQAQADAFLTADVAWAVSAVNTYVSVALNQNQFDALVSLVFNIGSSNFHTSTLLKNLNAGDYASAAQQFLVWNKSGGQYVLGLAKRRLAEARIFQDGDYTPSTSAAFQC